MFLIEYMYSFGIREVAGSYLSLSRERDRPSSCTRQAVPSSRRASATRPSPPEPRTGPYLPLTDIRGAVRGVQGAGIDSKREDSSLKFKTELPSFFPHESALELARPSSKERCVTWSSAPFAWTNLRDKEETNCG